MTDTILFAGFALAYLVLLGWGAWLASRHGWLTAANLPLLVVLGLVYDNTLLAAGRAIGEGALLEALNVGRFWIHAFLTPLLVVFAWHACRRAGCGWASTRVAAWGAGLFAAALVVLELVTVVAPLEVEATREHGILSYSDTGSGEGPPLMVLFIAAALIVAGLFVWLRQKWPWLFVGSAVMTLGSAVEVPVESGAITNAFELVLLVSILATKHFQDSRERTHPR